MFGRGLANEFARDVRAGLTRTEQKTLPCRYLYDEVGSALFDAITCLPEYGLTRADTRILQAHAGDLVEMLPPNVVVAELGSGSGAKTRPVLEQIHRRQVAVYYPIDLSQTALAHCAVELGTTAAVLPVEASYLDGLRRVAERRAPGQTLLVLFLGSTIGNFEPEAAIDFLLAIRLVLHPGDVLLLGTDLVKPVEQMIAAYDDAAGVTAAFNLNLLARINRELDGGFRPAAVRARGAVHRGGAAHRDAPALTGIPDCEHPGGGPDRGFRAQRDDLHGGVPQVRAGADLRDGADVGVPAGAAVGGWRVGVRGELVCGGVKRGVGDRGGGACYNCAGTRAVRRARGTIRTARMR